MNLMVLMRKDLFAAYRDVCSKPCPSQLIAWHRTIKHPAKRFYIQEKKVENVVGPMMHGDYSEYYKIKSENSRRRYRDLKKVCMELIQTKEFCDASFHKVAEKAVTMPAPEFYITHNTLRKLFRYTKRFGLRYQDWEAKLICSKYTNHKDGKPKDAVYNKKLITIGL